MNKLDIFGNPDTIKTTLQGKFIVPPFSVLDARQGYWQKRKRQWLKLGLQSEVGRGGDILPGGGGKIHTKTCYLRSDGKSGVGSINKSRKKKKAMSRAYSCNDGMNKVYDYLPNIPTGTSIFDPVLTELMYRWFCPDDGKILDPFAGGSVRGIVANLLGYKYTGIELREGQIVANVEQGHDILPDSMPEWICGNSKDVCSLVKKEKCFDFIFSCPPYYDLEVYSDLKGELSNYKSYKSFLHHYKIIITQCMSLLKEDRFACFVVSNIRDKKGFYLNICNDTINAFQKVGGYFYNEIILVTAIGSLPIRVGRQFVVGRKIGKTHQNILVFYKGDPKNIKKIFPQEIRKE